MADVKIWATHKALPATDDVSGSPYEYVLRADYDVTRAKLAKSQEARRTARCELAMFQHIWICRPCSIIYSPEAVGAQALTQCPNCAEADLEELTIIRRSRMRKARKALEDRDHA